MKRTFPIAFNGLCAFVLIPLLTASCTQDKFTGDGKSKTEKKQETAQPTQNTEQPNQLNENGSNIGGQLDQDPSLEPSRPTPQAPNSQSTPEENSYAVRFPVIGIINMDSKYQITNEGYRVSVEKDGQVLAQAPLNLRSLMDGSSVDMQGSAYGKPFLTNSKASYTNANLVDGRQKAKISICMPKDINAPWNKAIDCRDLNGFVGHSNGSNTFVNLDADVEVKNHNVVVNAIYGATSKGNCGTQKVPCASIMHPVFGFAVQSGDGNNDNASPLVLDLNQNGKIDLLSAFIAHPVHFDIAGLGTKIRTGWVAPGDGLLALDINKNGTIDNGSELFGEHSHSKSKNMTKFDNGYLALAQFDLNRDGKIDHKDAVYKDLLVWRDQNQDGISQKWELSGMLANDIASLNLDYEKLGSREAPVMNNGNEVRLMGSFTTKSGKTLAMADVWFELRLNQTIAEIISH